MTISEALSCQRILFFFLLFARSLARSRIDPISMVSAWSVHRESRSGVTRGVRLGAENRLADPAGGFSAVASAVYRGGTSRRQDVVNRPVEFYHRADQ